MLRDKILELRKKGKTYNEIRNILGCSKSTISYHCNLEVKKRNYERTLNRRSKLGRDWLDDKVQGFKNSHRRKEKRRKWKADKNGYNMRAITQKRKDLIKRDNEVKHLWTAKDFRNHIGNNTYCYLTGNSINIEDRSDYQLDHIIPVSRGGTNELNNLGILKPEVNTAKGNLLVEEFLKLCIDVLEYNGYKISKS